MTGTAPTNRETDVLVVGSGAGGLTAAVAAAALGLDVLVVEKASVLGGTTALSEGMIWIPGNAQARARGIADSAEAALDYIGRAAGNAFERERAARFVEAAPEMLGFMTEHSEARFILAAGSCDYLPDLPGASTGGRALDPAPYDGRRLGADFARLRRPLATTQIFGGMSISGTELGHYFKVFRSAKSTALVARRLARYGWDRLCGRPRGTLIGNGNALVARLLASLRARDVPVWEGAPVRRLLIEAGRVTGAEIDMAGRGLTLRARRGVVLACGGFTASDEMKRRHYPHIHDGKNHTRLAPETNTGDGTRLAEAAGGWLNTALAQPAAWAPVSLVPQKDGGTVPYPHFIDRNKPGFIIVDRHGRRFVNESDSYHLIVQAMVEACRADETVEAWILADHPAIRRYGIGVVPPWPGRTGPHRRNGYLKTGDSLAALARVCGIDPKGLGETVARFNANASRGEDPDFARGLNAYNRANGDAAHHPNPALGPLATPPFYALRIVPGDLGTFYGLDTTPDAQVRDANGVTIPGLYAVGNDMASVMGGAYIGAGITIGAAMTFGYVAAKHMAAQEPQENP